MFDASIHQCWKQFRPLPLLLADYDGPMIGQQHFPKAEAASIQICNKTKWNWRVFFMVVIFMANRCLGGPVKNVKKRHSNVGNGPKEAKKDGNDLFLVAKHPLNGRIENVEESICKRRERAMASIPTKPPVKIYLTN